MEALREMHKEKFLKMSVQDRANALFAACNLEPKSVLLLTIKKGTPYAQADLVDTIRKRYNLDAVPFGEQGLFSYLKHTLAPISMVVEGTKLVDGKYIAAYTTDLGRNYGDAVCLRALLLGDFLEIPLTKLLGSTATTGKIRHGYTVAKVIEYLCNQDSEHRVTDIVSSTGIKESVVSTTAEQLVSIGLARYSGIEPYTYVKGSGGGYVVAVLQDNGKLEMYRADKDALRKDVGLYSTKFHLWGAIESALDLGYANIECNALARDLGINERTASELINRLVDLGVYKFAVFGGGKQSACSITDYGRYAYETLFGPVLKISENPQSQEAIIAFNSVLKIDEARLITLVGKALKRYSSVKVSHTSHQKEELQDAVKLTLRISGSFMRPKEVKERLPGNIPQRSKETTRRILSNLHKGGEIEKAGFWHWDGAGRLSRTQDVYYRIFQPIVAIKEVA
ncbi:MAG: hypothetical protein KGH77_03295 [Candidatus Micrarchaeota archaeon]|nr:hypothetical protein [Candidatus Micrarchaeota archaeon]MDE1864426.1 hypothetical protein [Candidatus Micrarchaeota archaeon]